jgi:chloramphenicol-sensitive protein RarD
MKQQDDSPLIHQQIRGTGYAVAAFLLWGVLPLYWKALKIVPALEILTHRIVWSFIFMVILIAGKRRWTDLKAMLTERRQIPAVLACAVLISINWGTYIWAVNAGHMVESSLGYYINPLLSIGLGMLVLREKLNFWQGVALGIAASGVLILTFQYGRIPWIALTLAVSFGLYGLVKKVANIESVIGLTLETSILAPCAFGYLLWLQQKGSGAFGNSPFWVTLLLAGAGIITALPLLWFARAAQTIPLSVVGFIQYLTPTMMLLFGLFLYHEIFTITHLISFGFIWCALVLFSCSQAKFMQAFQPQRFRERRGGADLPVNEEL